VQNLPREDVLLRLIDEIVLDNLLVSQFQNILSIVEQSEKGVAAYVARQQRHRDMLDCQLSD
jgi:hypothetical protein